MGWLHHGHFTAPSGGGHYSVNTGFTDSAWIVNDPNGEANLATGGYTNNLNGANLSYSYNALTPDGLSRAKVVDGIWILGTYSYAFSSAVTLATSSLNCSIVNYSGSCAVGGVGLQNYRQRFREKRQQ